MLAGSSWRSMHESFGARTSSMLSPEHWAVLTFRYVLEDVTRDSLVLVDELGKGTEVRAGTAIAASVLEALHTAGCKVGCWSTWPFRIRAR